MEREMELDKQREDLVKQAMVMLNAWKSHSQVAIALCDALLKMAEVGGDEALKEMEKRGLGVLASTVADLHSDRCEVARCALRLLSKVSIELLLLTVEEQRNSNTMVGLGLEALNRRVKNDQKKLDELAKYGGRELLDGLEVEWKGSRMISLHILNLRRRLRRSTTKSIKKIYEVQLPPEDVVILRETFDAVDPEKTGSVDKVQFGEAMKILRIQFSEDDIEEAIREVDLDGSGMLDWPEFLFLMNRFGSNFSIENKFTEERLKEMRQVFEMFDADNSGTLDIGELRDVMHSIGLAPEEWEIRAMIAEVDDDNSGEIEWAEFLYLMSKKTVDAENQSRLAFEYFLEKNDTSGKIWKNRFVEQMQKLTSEFTRQELEAMLVQAKCEDMDTSYMTYKEFVKMMMTV
jgi:Ca2+-binding EF-hand superfamily protein